MEEGCCMMRLIILALPILIPLLFCVLPYFFLKKKKNGNVSKAEWIRLAIISLIIAIAVAIIMVLIHINNIDIGTYISPYIDSEGALHKGYLKP